MLWDGNLFLYIDTLNSRYAKSTHFCLNFVDLHVVISHCLPLQASTLPVSNLAFEGYVTSSYMCYDLHNGF
jgi:hypothetical protein